ncbi:hypothetical protein GCM10027414_24240 [Humibacter ginsengiterrae]
MLREADGDLDVPAGEHKVKIRQRRLEKQGGSRKCDAGPDSAVGQFHYGAASVERR